MEDYMRGDFGKTLRQLMNRPDYSVTPGSLSRLAGVPKATIVNWMEDRVRSPRRPEALRALVDALRLNWGEAEALYLATGQRTPEILSASAFDFAPIGLYVTTPSGRIVHANVRLVKVLGYASLADYCRLDVGHDLYLHAEQREKWVDQINRVGTIRNERVWARRSNGSAILMSDSAAAVYDTDGRILRYEGSWEPVDTSE